MVAPSDAMNYVAKAIAESDEMPAEAGLTLHEADMESDDADVDMPLIEIQPSEVEHVTVSNTDFVSFIEDDNGNSIGRVYLSEFEMTIQIDIWTSRDDGYDPDDLGHRLRRSLYPYSDYGPGRPFLDEEGDVVDDITYFRILSGERTDDLITTPTVRRWSHEVELWGYEGFRTTEDYILDVSYPSNGDLSDDQDDDTDISG